jgi:hypothetical protein
VHQIAARLRRRDRQDRRQRPAAHAEPGRREDIDNAMEEGMMEIVPRLEKRTHYIATFANVITLVGLLGTIIGLIKGFTAVAAVNPAEKAEMLSASISIAMNNTAFALMVAIPFLLIHAFLQARTSEIVDGLEAAKISFLNLVQRIKAESNPAARLSQESCADMRSPAQTRGELEVTAFINLIVVLVPFLLSTAVFTRLSVIDLSLPAQNSGVEQLKVDDLQLEVVIRPTRSRSATASAG